MLGIIAMSLQHALCYSLQCTIRVFLILAIYFSCQRHKKTLHIFCLITFKLFTGAFCSVLTVSEDYFRLKQQLEENPTQTGHMHPGTITY